MWAVTDILFGDSISFSKIEWALVFTQHLQVVQAVAIMCVHKQCKVGGGVFRVHEKAGP